MNMSNNPDGDNKTGLLGRLGLVVLFSLIAFLFVYVLNLASCNWSCGDDSAQFSTAVALLTALVVSFFAFRPYVSVWLRENQRVETENYEHQDLAYDLAERRRMEREKQQRLDDVVLNTLDGVLKGTVNPQLGVMVIRAIEGNSTVLRLNGVQDQTFSALPASTARPMGNPNDYRLVVSGGFASPIKGVPIGGLPLGCTLKSLRAAVTLAEVGDPPTRPMFAKRGIPASEEADECKEFLGKCGLLLDGKPAARGAWAKWHQALNPSKFAAWVAMNIDVIERNGGEDVYRKAARMLAENTVDADVINQ